MCPPVPEKVNGLVTHYTVFYSILNNSDVHNATAFTGNETCTQTVIIDLRKFTDYRLKVAASTHIGIGPKSDDFAIKRTLEDGKKLAFLYQYVASLFILPLGSKARGRHVDSCIFKGYKKWFLYSATE